MQQCVWVRCAFDDGLLQPLTVFDCDFGKVVLQEREFRLPFFG
jgi:hypothetical protein